MFRIKNNIISKRGTIKQKNKKILKNDKIRHENIIIS